MRSADRVAQLLRKRIALGGFVPGARLPAERELAETLGVSRNTMREAIRTLAREGLVETTLGRGGGTRVLEFGGIVSAAEKTDAADEFSDFIRHRMEHRLLLEPAAAGFAAVRASAGQRASLTELLERPVPDLVSYHQADTDFHLAIARASANPVLLDAIIDARTELFVGGNALWLDADWRLLYGDDAEIGEVFRAEHAEIAAAVVAGDAALAEDTMRAHLETSIEQFARLIGHPGGRD